MPDLATCSNSLSLLELTGAFALVSVAVLCSVIGVRLMPCERNIYADGIGGHRDKSSDR